MAALHQKYAPILRFNKGENFYPMRLDDMLKYSSLYAKDRPKPLAGRGKVTPELLDRHSRSPDLFLRSVEKGPLTGAEVVAEWSEGAVEMVYRWAAETSGSWSEEFARKAYDWFSPKTKSATQLFWWNGLVVNVLEGAVQSVAGNQLPRLILPAEIQADALERYQAGFKKEPGYAYYYRQVEDSGYLCLQYWFFYGYNDWGHSFGGLNDHEGDWEGIMLFFRLEGGRPQEPPAYVTFATHESRLTKAWDHPDLTRSDTHPIGYGGAGSHATYLEARTYPLMKLYGLFDYAKGDGDTINHDDWVHRINLDTVPWLVNYQGTWGTRYWLRPERAKSLLRVALAAIPFSALAGLRVPDEIELPGVSGPRGPVGQHRPQSLKPAAWAGVPPA